ncbi:hypothetical protein BDD12DRAFT_120263 [Trichophaea hybrida]|nr:hypothetical protein BDD12DRAFT_120263 [Trichophaea hybrida]
MDSEFDDTDYATDAPLPTPRGTPYDRTPMLSRHSSRGQSPSPYPLSSSPIPNHGRMSPPHHRRMSVNNSHHHDGAFDETISILDPRRFTPTLHANLVAEILSLRRELESKCNLVDSLENELESARADHETATASIATAQKEARDAKRMLARAEKDDAMTEVAKERDEAVEALAEMKKQMERLTKSRRAAEEDLERMRKVQERDNEKYEEAKRGFERRAHVAEGRLKAVLDEIAASNAMPPPEAPPVAHHRQHQRVMSQDTIYGDFMQSDTASIRSMSIRGRPTSLMMGDDEAERLGISLHSNGLSLADELDFDETEEDEAESDVEHYPQTDADRTDAEDYTQTDAELDMPAEMITDDESEEEIDELPELADMGVQVVPEINYEERVHILEGLLDEKNAELESACSALEKKTADMEALHLVLNKANTRATEVEERLEFLRSQGAEMDKEYLEREAKFDDRVDAFKAREKAKEMEFEAKSLELKQKTTSFDATKKMLDERVSALDDRENMLDDREHAMAAKDARIQELKESIDKELARIEREKPKDGQQVTVSELKRVMSKRVERATSPPLGLVYVSTKSQTIELPPPPTPPKPVYVSAISQTVVPPSPPKPVYVSTKSQTTALPAPPKPAKSAYVSKISQTFERPSPTAPPKPLYVSTESQTIELPSPPNTPQLESAEIPMQSAGTQTDPMKPVKPSIIRVPAIMVSPPEPTPPLPKPVMKNASVQTRPMRVRTHSMQTEEIRLDERLKKFAPHLLPSLLLPKEKPSTEPEPVPISPPQPPRKSSKRTYRRSATAPTPAPTSAPIQRLTGTADMGVGTAIIYDSPKSADDVDLRKTPSKSRKDGLARNLFNNIDLSPDNEMHSSGDDGFPEEGDSGSEYKTALSAPKPKGYRKAPSSALGFPPVVPDISERFGDVPRRQPSMRRNAMVTSGVNAHARVRSPSLASNRTTESGSTVTKIGPPFPVPARHSSKRPGYLSDRDRASPSPTPMLTRNTSRPRPRRPQSIRKVRSATALPNTRDQDGRRSPAPLSTSSNAPDSPGLPPPLPKDEIHSPAFDRRGLGQSNHRHQASNNTSTTGQASVGSVQQTSVVDAIAQTMVGEWMWKYVRRRRSFGVSESPQGDDVAGGQRHKRWVWLAPYERAVMWSSRQPTSGSALLGKSGRKRKRSILHPFGGPDKLSDVMDKVLTRKVLIQSVLDVKDDTPLPKGATQPIFNRSILILTPARALKFTAPSRERHYVWLTALSFLSHSADSNDGLLALPPPMPFEYEQVHRQQNQPHPAPPPVPAPAPARTNAFSATRDSVHLAKGKSKASSPAGTNGFTSRNASGSINPPRESLETLSAEPPSIPRFPGASRRRSNSNMRRPQTSTSHGYERSLASYATSNTGSTNRDSFYGVGGIGLTSANSSISHGVSGGGMAGGWEAGPMGTVRMEAFVDRRPRSSRHESYWGRGGFYGDDDDDFFRGDDPFRGF